MERLQHLPDAHTDFILTMEVGWWAWALLGAVLALGLLLWVRRRKHRPPGRG